MPSDRFHIASIACCTLLTFGLVAGRAAFAQPTASPSNPEAIRLFNSAVELQNQGLLPLAADEWRELLNRFGDDPLAARGGYYLGTCLFQDGKFDAAAAAFANLLAKHPQFAERSAAMLNLGLARYSDAQAKLNEQEAAALYEQAVAAFDGHLKQFADDPLAAQSQFYLAESQYALGERERALAIYTDWLTKHAGNELEPRVILALAGTAIELDKPADAIARLKQLLNKQPDELTTATAQLRLGEALIAVGKPNEAVDLLTAAANANFADADYALQQLGTAKYAAGEIAAAAQTFAEVARKFPQSPLAEVSQILAAGYYVEAGQSADAMRIVNEAKAAGVANVELSHWQARAQIDLGDSVTALATCDEALAKPIEPADKQLLLLDRADALYATEATRGESLAAYEIAAAGDASPNIAGRALHLAAATALELGKLAEAVEFATKYGERFPEGGDLANTLQVLAEAQLQGANAKAAAITYEKLLASVDKDDERLPEWSVRYGWALFTSEQYATAAEKLAPLAVSQDPIAREAAYLAGRSRFQLKQYDAALPLLAKAADADSAYAEEATLIIGQSQLALDQPKQAVATLTAAIQRFPQGKLADRFHFRLGEAALAAGDSKLAATEFAKVIADYTDSPLAPYARYRAARLAASAGDSQRAIDLLKGFADAYPNHPLVGDATIVTTSALQKLGKHDEALAMLDGSTAGVIDANRLGYAEAVSLAGAGRYSEAATKLEALRKQAPNFAAEQVLYELAFAYKNDKKVDESLETFVALANVAPNGELGREALFRQGEIHYDRGEFETAADKFFASVTDATEKSMASQAKHLEGWANLKAKRYPQAIAAWQQQLAFVADDNLAADAKWLVGEAAFQNGQFGEALKLFDAAGDKLPTAPGVAPLVLLHAGQAAGQVEKWAESIDWLEQLRIDFPDYALRNEGLFELAVALQKTGKLDEARQLFASVATGSTPLAYRARFMAGEMQFAAKQYDQAVRTFFQVFAGPANAELGDDYQPWQAESMFEAARCLEQLDKRDAAGTLYTQLIERFPKHPKAELARKQLSQ